MDNFYIVYGSMGLIGSIFVNFLEKNNIPYIGFDIIDNFKKQKSFIKHNLSLDSGMDYVYDYISKNKIIYKPVIVNFASDKIPFYGNRFNCCYNNTKIILNSIDLAKRLNANIVFTSTSDIYGFNKEKTELSECHIGSSLNRRWAYAATKIFGEHMYIGYKEETKNKIIIVRLDTCYGPHINWAYPWKSGFLASMIHDAIVNNEINITADFSKMKRSFIHVDDFINFLFVLIKDINNADYNIINTSSDKKQILLSIILDRLICKLSDYGINPKLNINLLENIDIIDTKEVNVDLAVEMGFTTTKSVNDIITDIIEYVLKNVNNQKIFKKAYECITYC